MNYWIIYNNNNIIIKRKCIQKKNVEEEKMTEEMPQVLFKPLRVAKLKSLNH